MEKCADCLAGCPWCGSRRWQIRDRGCGSIVAKGSEARACRKSKRMKGVACPKCGYKPGQAAEQESSHT